MMSLQITDDEIECDHETEGHVQWKLSSKYQPVIRSNLKFAARGKKNPQKLQRKRTVL